MKTIFLDIMIGERYFCTIKYKYCQAFKIKEEDLREFCIKKKPVLARYEFRIEFDQI